METLSLYFQILNDSSIPSNRVVRKTAFLTFLLVGALIYYRHFILQFGFGEPALMTLGLSFMVIIIVGIFGGLLAASFYESFLKDVNAQNKNLTVSVFFTEWLFAITSPLLGVFLFGFINSHVA